MAARLAPAPAAAGWWADHHGPGQRRPVASLVSAVRRAVGVARTARLRAFARPRSPPLASRPLPRSEGSSECVRCILGCRHGSEGR